MSYYLVPVLNSVGITDAKTQNIINGTLQIFNYFTAIGTAFLIDRFGRKRLFLISTIGMSFSFIIWTVISAKNQQQDFKNPNLGKGVVVMIFVFYFFYNIAMNPVPIAYINEILPYTLRAKGILIFNIAQFGSGLFNGFVNPIAMDAIGWKYYIIFACAVVVWGVLIHLFYPETRGRSLEEVAEIFDGGRILECFPEGEDEKDQKGKHD